MIHETKLASVVCAGFTAWLVGLVQVAASHFQVTPGEMIAFASFLTGPPILVVTAMWVHLNKRIGSLSDRLDRHVVSNSQQQKPQKPRK